MIKENNIKKIVFTGGHHNSAIATIDYINQIYLKKHTDLKLKFYWMGRRYVPNTYEDSPEYIDVTKRGIPFYDIKAGKLFRTVNVLYIYQILKNLIFVPVGFLQSFLLIFMINPDIIVSFGGYLGLPPVFAGWILRKRSMIHEQTSTMGLSNKIIINFVDKICVSWPIDRYGLSITNMNKTVYTGLPIRESILKSNYNVPYEYKKFNKKLPIVYVTGGKLGSMYLNQMLYEIINKLSENMNIIWQCGQSTSKNYDGDYGFDAIRKKVNTLTKERQNRIVVKEYIFEDSEISYIYTKSDLVISRGGAHTVYELGLLNKNSIIIPIPWSSNDEQKKNAKILEMLGIATVLEQNTTNSRDLEICIYSSLKKKIPDLEKGLFPPNGGELLTNEIFKTL